MFLVWILNLHARLYQRLSQYQISHIKANSLNIHCWAVLPYPFKEHKVCRYVYINFWYVSNFSELIMNSFFPMAIAFAVLEIIIQEVSKSFWGRLSPINNNYHLMGFRLNYWSLVTQWSGNIGYETLRSSHKRCSIKFSSDENMKQQWLIKMKRRNI